MYIIFPPGVVSFIRNNQYKKQSYKRKENEKKMYDSHAYDNISYPYLPEGTTYTTYYMSGQGAACDRCRWFGLLFP